ncbi:hypothetical protein [Vibrio gallaecicus]|uniref:Uncharacterized protein n=1 Tax=Vibrio gallaecicus TaxID=552386 RepID=A0ABV4NB98_9VIBR
MAGIKGAVIGASASFLASVGYDLVKGNDINWKRTAIVTTSGAIVGATCEIASASLATKSISPTQTEQVARKAAECGWAKYNGTSSPWFDKDAWQYMR